MQVLTEVKGNGGTIEGNLPAANVGASSMPNDGSVAQWIVNTAHESSPCTSTMLYVNVEDTFPPSPPPTYLERDPNMSSTARYSPIHNVVANAVDGAHSYARITGSSKTNKIQPCNGITINANSYEISTVKSEVAVAGDDANSSMLISSSALCTDESESDSHPGIMSVVECGAVSSEGEVSHYAMGQAAYAVVGAGGGVECAIEDMSNSQNSSTYPTQSTQQISERTSYFNQFSIISTDYNGVESSSDREGNVTSMTEDVTVDGSEQFLDSNGEFRLILSPNGSYHMFETANEADALNGSSTITYSLSHEDGFIVARPTTTTVDKDNGYTINNDGSVEAGVLNSFRPNGSSELALPNQYNTLLPVMESVANISKGSNLTTSSTSVNLGNCFETVQDITSDNEVSSSSNTLYRLAVDDDHSSLRSTRKQLPQSTADSVFTCIPDVSVPCRARASLPAAFLSMSISGCVFTRRRLPPKTRFGPVDGFWRQLTPKELDVQIERLLNGNQAVFLVKKEDGRIFQIDVSDENKSNWMRYLRNADAKTANLWLEQQKDELFAASVTTINARSELRIGYSAKYLQTWTMFKTKPEEAELKMEDKFNPTLEWPCYECFSRFATSPELQAHLDTHDESQSISTMGKKPKKKLNNSIHKCEVCHKVFPRGFSLTRHMRTHENKCIYEIKIISKNDENSNKNIFTENNNFPIANNNNVLMAIDNSVNDLQSSKQTTKPIKQASIDSGIFEPALNSESNMADTPLAVSESKTHHVKVELNDNRDSNENNVPNLDSNVRNETSSENKNCTVCVLCSEVIKNKAKLKEHVYKHKTEDDFFNCIYCTKRFPNYTAVRKHIVTYHVTTNRHVCQQCDAVFAIAQKLQLHMLRHSDFRQFVCSDCGKAFKRRDKLKHHVKMKHLSQPKEENVSTTRKPDERKPDERPLSKADYHSYTFVCRSCQLGFKRRGMLVNHLARRHPETPPSEVPELCLPIQRATRDYYCQYCEKVYKSSSKRKQHILKNHPGESIPPSKRGAGRSPVGAANYSACVGSVPVAPHHCPRPACHKQYASKAKLLQHIRSKHPGEPLPAPARQKDGSQTQDSNMSVQYNIIRKNTEPQVLMAKTTMQQTNNVPNPIPDLIPTTQPGVQNLNLLNTNTMGPQTLASVGTPDIYEYVTNDKPKYTAYLKQTPLLNYTAFSKDRFVSNNYVTQQLEYQDANWLQKWEKSESIPKLQISGHILSLGKGTKLPSMNVLNVGGSKMGSLASQYTDR